MNFDFFKNFWYNIYRKLREKTMSFVFDDFDLEIQSDELMPEDYDERIFLLYNESESE